jgi:hypothetical protein
MTQLVCLMAESREAEQSLVVVHKDGLRQKIHSIASEARLVPLGIAFTKSGILAVAYQQSGGVDPNEVGTFVIIGSEKRKLSVDYIPTPTGDSAYPGRSSNPVQFAELQGRLVAVYRHQPSLIVEGLGHSPTSSVAAERSRYDFSALSTANGYLYVLYHSENDLSLHAAVSNDATTFWDVALDDAQSGRQLSACAFGDTVVVAYTYDQSPILKGLRAVALQNGHALSNPVVLAEAAEIEAGLDPHLSISKQGTAWLSFVTDSSKGSRAWWRTSPEGIVTQRMRQVDTPTESSKDWAFRYGIGTGVNWLLLGDGYSGSKAVTHYSMNPNSLVTTSIDARMGGVGFAINAGNEIDPNTTPSRMNRAISGALRFALGENVDLRLSMDYARFFGTMDWQGGAEKGRVERAIDIKPFSARTEIVLDIGINLGLEYRRLSVPANVHTYQKTTDDTSPQQYVTSYLRDVRFDNIGVVVGYSSVEHLKKDKWRFNGPFINGGIGAGFSLFHFDPVAIGDQSVASSSGGFAHAELQLGWLLYQRWGALGGGGVYARPFYRADGGIMTNGPSQKKGATGALNSVSAYPSMLWLNHALMIEAGMSW